MSGLIFLFILAIWFFIVKKLSGYCVFKMQPGTKKTITQIVIFILFFIAPVADEIIGRFQFRALCEQGSQLIYDEEQVKGKTVVWSGKPRSDIKNTIIPIEEMPIEWIDSNTGKMLIKYKQYYATGGWISRTVAFNNVTKPYLYSSVCGAKKELDQLKRKMNLETVYK